MDRPTRLCFGVSIAALLAVLAVVGLGWYNWWLRHGWVRIYPQCQDAEWAELTEPLSPMGFKAFADRLTTWDGIAFRIYGDEILGRPWFRFIGRHYLANISQAACDDVVALRGRGERCLTCMSMSEIISLSGTRDPEVEEFPKVWMTDLMATLSFDVEGERPWIVGWPRRPEPGATPGAAPPANSPAAKRH